MTQDELKRRVAEAAVALVAPDSVIGVGTGSTVDRFIEALGRMPRPVAAAVSSSEASSARLRALGIRVLDANEVESLALYVDGADEIDRTGCMIKGGGAALTREKIVAELAERFVCIVDASKRVEVLGRFPLPIEVIPMAVALVVRRARALGGRPAPRSGVVTDNGNAIVDVRGLRIDDPAGLELAIGQWPGVVTVGLFARRRADACLVADEEGVQQTLFDNVPHGPSDS